MSATLSSTKWKEMKKKKNYSGQTQCCRSKKGLLITSVNVKGMPFFFSSSSSCGCCLPAMCCQDASVCWAFAKSTLCRSWTVSVTRCQLAISAVLLLSFFFSFNIHLFPLLKEQHYQKKKDKNSEEWRRREACFNNFYFIHQEEQGNKNKKQCSSAHDRALNAARHLCTLSPQLMRFTPHFWLYFIALYSKRL